MEFGLKNIRINLSAKQSLTIPKCGVEICDKLFVPALGQKKNTCVSGDSTDPTQWVLVGKLFFFLFLPILCPVLHSELFHSFSVNSVTAVNVFQMLEISVCVIVNFLQNGDRHSLGVSVKNVPISGAFTSSDPIPVL